MTDSAVNSTPLAHDKEMARIFLVGLDPNATRFTFQFFNDSGGRHAEIFHGTLDELWAKVLALNTPQRGVGVFVTIAETDFNGRRVENIVRARALFADADGKEQVASCASVLKTCGVSPSMVVNSGRGAHVYFCTDVPLHQFSPLQKQLSVKFGTDGAVKDLPRVMRLPGTLHLKDPANPRLVKLVVSGDDPVQRWQLPDLIFKLGLSPSPATPEDNVVPLKEREWAIEGQAAVAFAHLPFEPLGEGLAANVEEIRSAVMAIPLSVIADEGNWTRLAFGLAHEARVFKKEKEMWEILDAASQHADNYDQEENRQRFQRYMDKALDREDPITIRTVFHMAREHGWQGWSPPLAAAQEPDGLEKSPAGVSLSDFYAYMPMHNYIFAPSREPWPGSSVDARVGKIPLVDARGNPVLDANGKQKKICPSAWLDRNRPVEQMTWAPGLPMLIRDRLISDGGWIERPKVSCFNLYRPPVIVPGNQAEAQRWLDHLRKVFGGEADHGVGERLGQNKANPLTGASDDAAVAAQVEKIPGYVGDWERHVFSFLGISGSNLARGNITKRAADVHNLVLPDFTAVNHNFDKPQLISSSRCNRRSRRWFGANAADDEPLRHVRAY
jgi:hypothetical protein